MTSAIEQLSDNLLDHFRKLFDQDSGKFKRKMQFLFDSMGPGISPAMLKLNPSDSTYSTARAVETFSELTNNLPEINGDELRQTLATAEEFYKLLIEGAQSIKTRENELTVFERLKNDAIKKLDGTVGSCDQGKPPFLPAFATPTDWYDPKVINNWKLYSYKFNTRKVEGESGGQSTSSQGSRPKNHWEWRILPSAISPVLRDRSVITRLSLTQRSDFANSVSIKDQRSSLPQGTEDRLKTVLTVKTTSGVKSSAFSSKARVQGVTSISSKKLTAQPLSVIPSLKMMRLDSSNINKRINIKTNVESPVLQMARLAELQKQTFSQKINSTGLSLSFKYCVVWIDRPWWSQIFLSNSNWYIPGYQKGDLSDGKALSSKIFSALPIAVVFIKDLQISGWNDSETSLIESALSLGPFTFLGSNVNKETKSLICEGMQVVGWLCEYMPELPPASGPNEAP